MAGVVIAVLLFLTVAVVGAVVGIVFWIYQPWSNGWFGLEKMLTKRRSKISTITVMEFL